jgi:hypothetical protein
VAAVTELYAPAGEDGTTLGETETVAALRDEFDLPDRIDDPAVETAVAAALSALADGDHETALDALSETVTTPCEAHEPTRRSVTGSPGHDVACHLRHPPSGVRVPDEGRQDSEERAAGDRSSES